MSGFHWWQRLEHRDWTYAERPILGFRPDILHASLVWPQHCCLAALTQVSNIDRLLAIWQTLNWDSWFTSDASPPSTGPLPPFHHQFASGVVDYFKSDDVRQWLNFGYQYDVLERKLGERDEDYVKRIKAYVETTYQNTGRVLLNDRGNLFKDSKREGDTYHDYLINVLYDR